MEFYATCPGGFERPLADEVRDLGGTRVRPLTGQVAFGGGLEAAYRLCLEGRLASRVVAVLARSDAGDADELYEGVAAIPWEDHVPAAATLQVTAHGGNAELRDGRFVALRTKDAIADRLRDRRGAVPRLAARDADLCVVVRVGGKRASVGVELSGGSLARRGWERGGRGLSPAAAAALAGMAGVGAGEERPLVVVGRDPAAACVEACEIALALPAGRLRARWGHEAWLAGDAPAWERVRERAEERAGRLAEHAAALWCEDAARAREALGAAGLSSRVRLLEGPPAQPCAALADLSDAHADEPARQAAALSGLSRLCARLAAGSRLACASRDGVVARAVGAEPDARLEVRLGTGEALLSSYALDGTSRPEVELRDGRGTRVGLLVPTSDQFAARLAKVARLSARRARGEDVSCYRVYDSDLPDYRVSIDRYRTVGEDGRTHAVVSEYAAPAEVDPDLARARLLDVLAVVPPLLGCEPRDVHVRVRSRSRGGSQYADAGSRRAGGAGPAVVEEGGLEFEVDLDARLDTGIFLDDREIRSMLREMAKPDAGGRRRFLNLFAYTGTATCYAADGGAETTTVDLSQTYLDWARRNMARNGFAGAGHEYVRADVVRWVAEQRRGRRRWDLVFCAPPTFSNSSRMGRRSFDVQRDHAELLIGVSRLLARGGTCVFSCNLRSFSLDADALARAGVVAEDVTERTMPWDFARDRRVHHCFLVRRA